MPASALPSVAIEASLVVAIVSAPLVTSPLMPALRLLGLLPPDTPVIVLRIPPLAPIVTLPTPNVCPKIPNDGAATVPPLTVMVVPTTADVTLTAPELSALPLTAVMPLLPPPGPSAETFPVDVILITPVPATVPAMRAERPNDAPPGPLVTEMLPPELIVMSFAALPAKMPKLRGNGTGFSKATLALGVTVMSLPASVVIDTVPPMPVPPPVVSPLMPSTLSPETAILLLAPVLIVTVPLALAVPLIPILLAPVVLAMTVIAACDTELLPKLIAILPF